jgi:RNA polymerase primary sigma factor
MASASGVPSPEEQTLNTYLREIRRYTPISRQEEAELAARIRQGDKLALQQLVCANLRFVISVAKKYQNNGLSLMELICEGNVGLIRAGQRFDGTKGFKFISYAVWWVRQAILKALSEQPRAVRIPLNRIAVAQKVEKGVAALAQEHGREPTTEEIAEAIDVRVDDVERALAVIRPHVSLDNPGRPDGRPLVDSIRTEDKAFRETPFEQHFGVCVEDILCLLDHREAEIVIRHFGLDSRPPESLRKIAASFGVSSQRLRQIEKRALRKMRRLHKQLT